MRDTSAQHFVGIDIGTSQARCVVGTLDGAADGKIAVIGYSAVPNTGMRKGTVAHIDEVAAAVSQAVIDAERVAGIKITQATVNINGAHVQGIDSKGVVAISGSGSEITEADRLRAEEAAMVVSIPANREIIQFFPKNYSVDGQRNIKDPVGMHGVRLEVEAHLVTGSSPAIRNLDSALEKAGVEVRHHTVSSLAAAEAVLSRQQKEAGTLLLDIGAGATNFIVVEDGEVQHVAVIPIGGLHLTNDLAIGLRTDLEIAQQVQRYHARLGMAGKTTAIVNEHGQHHTFDMDEVMMITEARIDELLEYVDRELHKIKRSRKLPGGVVLVGGVAELPGLAAFTREKLQLAARVGTLQPLAGLTDKLNQTTFATAAGLMLLDMLLPAHQGQARPSLTGSLKFVDNLLQRFHR